MEMPYGGRHLAGLEGGAQLVAGEPAGLVDLVAVDVDLGGGGAGHEAEHEAGRERPGLAGDVLDLADGDAGLLVHLAAHRLLDGLARLDESGERREAALGPVDLAAEQDAVLVVDDEP